MSERVPSMSDWLETELYRRRTLQLAGALDDETGARLAAALMTMDAEGDDAVELRMTSPGGSIDAAFALIDTIDLLGVPVKATAMGAVVGPAAFVLALCPVRRATPSALIRLAEPASSHRGSPDDLVRAAAEERRRMETLVERLSGTSGRASEEIAADIRAGRTFTAPQAVEAGLIDEISFGKKPASSEASPIV